jgi:hypothetical protein
MFDRRQAWMALSVIVGTVGCASLDRAGAKLDMVAGRVENGSRPAYEGRLEAARPFGSMTALQFADGRFFDVSEAPEALVPGDTVRIYKTETGYAARLWRPAQAPDIAIDNPKNPPTKS